MTDERHPWRRFERRALIAAVFLALGMSILLLVLPVYSGVSETTSAGSVVSTIAHFRRTLLAVNGPSVLIPLAVPVLISAFPFAFTATRFRETAEVIAACLLLAFVIVAGFSIGVFYAPSAGAMIAAAASGSGAVAREP
jgi:hypothetical protein